MTLLYVSKPPVWATKENIMKLISAKKYVDPVHFKPTVRLTIEIPYEQYQTDVARNGIDEAVKSLGIDLANMIHDTAEASEMDGTYCEFCKKYHAEGRHK